MATAARAAVAWRPTMLKFLLLSVVLLLALTWNLDVVDARYATRAEFVARGRGWLPLILPGSARDIHTVNNLDLNTSRGEFRFSDTDAGAFFARLSLDVPAQALRRKWPGLLEGYRESGHVAWSYEEAGMRWVFFCHPAKDACHYVMWMSQAPAPERLASPKQADTRHRPQ
jgi:hypothetical protein